MLIVKDAMVLIHLAKTTLLETSCSYFGTVMVPQLVYQEVERGREKNYPDAELIGGLVRKNRIAIKRVVSKALIKKAEAFNIFGGEAEAVALYWQEKAELLATDDDNVRKKQAILKLDIMGTPAIVLKLYREKKISADKFRASVYELRKVGWFSNAVIDKLLMEAK
ncbi:hypothetical protein HYV82_04350 [Candidatus Woesearchaeota archaeon]|nr:hypothetical protein [Candidatus Woesearchaeota archaeon]